MSMILYPYIHTLTSIFIADSICSHKRTLLAKKIIMSNRFYCITEQRLNDILIYFNDFMEM